MAKNNPITDFRCARARSRVFDMLRSQGGRCFYCLSPIISPGDITLDHVVPKAHGGSDHRGNLVVACYSCNQQFGDLSVKMKLLWMIRYRPVYPADATPHTPTSEPVRCGCVGCGDLC